MDARSIDNAKTASIDMMSLNNKVVSMRPVVKRSKAQIVNRLCRHISALKKKKGTEAQKEKNIRKAERLIEEIESIRRLKEDKVSKYSLANTSTFESISKSTLSANMRALARLADHHLMKEVVNDFRQKHSDWRDLAAFLLIKQTGRKFKTKKQKQKKLAQRVENINASETMTKAYIEERFGKEGLEKAEQRFQKKRKKGKGAVVDVKETRLPEVEKEEETHASPDGKDTQTDNSISADDKIEKTVSESDTQIEVLTSVKKTNKDIGNDVMINVVQSSEEKMTSIESKDTSENSSVDNEEVGLESVSQQRSSEKEDDSEIDDSGDGENESENNESDENEDEDIEEEDQALGESEDTGASSEGEERDEDDVNSKEGIAQKEASATSTKPEIPSKGKSKSDECVVKKLNIGASSDESDDDEEEEESEMSAEDSDDTSMEDESNSDNSEPSKSEQDDDDDDEETESQQPHKKRKAQKESKSKKKKSVPEFLTKRDVLKNTPNDPFFVGSDGEEGDDDDGNVMRNTEMDFDVNNDDYYDDRGGSWSSRQKTKSMFYEPGEENLSGRRFEKRNFSSSFRSRGRGHFEYRGRGRSLEKSRVGFRGRGRGSFHSSDRGRGRETRDDGANRVFKFGSGGISQGEKRGSFFGRGSTHQGKGDTQKSFQKFGASSSKDSGPVSTTTGTEKLHPSWEASRKRKAEQSGLKAFEGTKIVFDDD